jgi:hypothetical protein
MLTAHLHLVQQLGMWRAPKLSTSSRRGAKNRHPHSPYDGNFTYPELHKWVKGRSLTGPNVDARPCNAVKPWHTPPVGLWAVQRSVTNQITLSSELAFIILVSMLRNRDGGIKGFSSRTTGHKSIVTEEYPSWEANGHSACPHIPYLLWKGKAHNNLPMSPTLCPLIPVHCFTLQIFKIRFNIIFPSMPTFLKYLFPLEFLIFHVSILPCVLFSLAVPFSLIWFQILTAASMRRTVFYVAAPCSVLQVYFYQATRRKIPADCHPHRNHIRRRVACNIKLLIMKCSLVYSYFSALTHKLFRKFHPSVSNLIKTRSSVSDIKRA